MRSGEPSHQLQQIRGFTPRRTSCYCPPVCIHTYTRQERGLRFCFFFSLSLAHSYQTRIDVDLVEFDLVILIPSRRPASCPNFILFFLFLISPAHYNKARVIFPRLRHNNELTWKISEARRKYHTRARILLIRIVAIYSTVPHGILKTLAFSLPSLSPLIFYTSFM